MRPPLVWWATTIALLLGFVLPGTALAHPLSPSAVRVTLLDDTQADVIWRTPTQRPTGTDVRLRWPDGCEVATTAPTTGTGAQALETHFRLTCRDGLAGRALRVDGLQAAGTNVVADLRDAKGARRQLLLTADTPEFGLSDAGETSVLERVGGYAMWGMGHFFGGWDHLLLLLGLAIVLIPAGRQPLLIAVAAFTVGHTATLVIATTQAVPWPPMVTETLIALTLVALGIEVLRPQHDPGPIRRHPALVPLGFGIVHGLGFAGALGSLDLPTADLWPALLGFNLGLEVAQLLMIGALLAAAWLMRMAQTSATYAWARIAGAYVIGTMGVFWTLDRLVG